MLHARNDYNRIQDPATNDPTLISEGSSPIGEDEPVFLVRASDQAFIGTLKEWVRLHDDAGGDFVMSMAVERHIEKAKEWQSINRVKVADAPDSALTEKGGVMDLFATDLGEPKSLIATSELRQLRDDSEALRLFAEMVREQWDTGLVVLSLTLNGMGDEEWWEIIDSNAEEFDEPPIASGPTPLAAVQAAKQKLGQEQG